MFGSTEEFGQFLQQLIVRHREDLTIILRRLGINRPLEPMTLVLAYEKFGDQFIKELSAIPADSFDGVGDKWKEVFEIGKSLITGVDPPAATGKSDDADKGDDPKPKPSFWTTKRIVVIGAITVAVLTVILFIIKKSK